MNRRLFLEGAMTLGLGALTLLKGTKPWGKGLMTEASAAEPPFSGQDVILLPPFEKNNPFNAGAGLGGPQIGPFL